MSDLEGAAKPVIEALLTASRYEFTISARRALARWSFKAAMVFESLGDQREPFYTQSERDAVRTGDLRHGYHAVWVGRAVDLNGLYCQASDLFDHVDSARSETRGYVTTLGIGPIAIQVLAVRLSDGTPIPLRVTIPLAEGPWQNIGQQIWPHDGTALDWEPTQALQGEHGLDALARRFRTRPA
jgi:hypothetical protein